MIHHPVQKIPWSRAVLEKSNVTFFFHAPAPIGATKFQEIFHAYYTKEYIYM